MAIEIECKIHIADLDHIRTRLSITEAIVVHPRVFEKNFRYENTAKELTPNGIVLRLRQDHNVRITYKAPLNSNPDGAVRRLELETSVGDFETMDAILQHLGFSTYMVYEKYRTTYHLADIPDAEIALDEMPYGNFIEVEGEPTAINMTLNRLDLNNKKRILKSYAELFDHVRDHYQLSFTDLTFENFANIVIDSAIFE